MHGHLRWLTASIVIICAAAGPARAIDQRKLIPLPHLGFGGEALACRTANGTGVTTVAGFINDSHGNSHACGWREKADDTGLFMLPGLGGRNSRANGITIVVDGDFGPKRIIAGGAETPAGVMTPVFWTEEIGGFAIHPLPTLGGPAGIANALFGGEYGDGHLAGIVGTSQNASGQQRATFWRITNNGNETIDLGTLGGSSSEAISIDFTAAGVVTGRAQTASGAWHACAWRTETVNKNETITVSDYHPGGASSIFTDCTGPYGLIACGTARSANGQSQGFFDVFPDVTIALDFRGAGNTSADAIVGTPYGNLTFGQAWNDPATMHPVVWNTVTDLGQTTAYPLGLIVNGLGGNDQLRVNAGQSRVAVGALDNGDITGPVIMGVTGVLPDRVNVTLGIPEPNFGETDLWQTNDGKTLRIKTRNQDGDAATFETRFYSSVTGTFQTEMLSLKIRARIAGSPDASAQMEVQVWNFETGIWDTVCQNEANPTWFFSQCPVAGAGHVNPSTGEVRIRVDITPLNGKVRGVEVDSVMLDIPPTLGL